MIMPMLFKNLIFLFMKKLFEMYPTQNVRHYVPPTGVTNVHGNIGFNVTECQVTSSLDVTESEVKRTFRSSYLSGEQSPVTRKSTCLRFVVLVSLAH